MRRKMTITRDAVRPVLGRTYGRMITVEFRKKNGEMRRLNGRLGVHGFTKGGHRAVNEPYVVMWEAPKPQEGAVEGRSRYRNVNLNTVSRIIADGIELEVI